MSKPFYILSAGASRPEKGKLEIIVNISVNYERETKYTYILPDDRDSFKKISRRRL